MGNQSYSEWMLESHGFLSWLGIELESAEPGRVVLTLPHREQFTNPGSKAVHGGITASLVDNAAGAAVRTMLAVPEDTPHATTDLDISYVRPATGDLRAEADVLRVGESVGVVRIDVTSVAPDGERKVVVAGQATMHIGTPDGVETEGMAE